MKITCSFLALFFFISVYSQQVKRFTESFETSDGIYGVVKISTKPMTFSGASIMIQQDAVIIQGIKYNGKNYSGNQLSAQGIQFPMECTNCYFTASGTVSMLIPGSVQRDYGRFNRGASIHKGGFLKANQEVIFSAGVKERHNANMQNGSAWINTGRVEELRISQVEGSDLHNIKNAVKKASASKNFGSNSENFYNSNGAGSKSTWSGQDHVAYVAEHERKAKNKAGNSGNGISREEFHRQHVNENNAAYDKRKEKLKAQETFQNFKNNKQQEHADIIEKQKREREAYYRELNQKRQALIEKQRRDNERMDRVATQAAQQVASGNYVGAGMTMAREAATQGSVEGVAVATVGGIFAQIAHDSAERKAKEREEEKRRLEQAQRERELARKKRELLAKQKREFNEMVDKIRKRQKAIIQAREDFAKEKITYTKTFDKFAKNGEPIYLFYTETNKNYNSYKENISFPNKVEIDIEDYAELKLSPVIAIYPNSSGEYPYLKDLLSQLKSKYFKKSNSYYKIYNWKRTLPEIQKLYEVVSEKALKANFNPIMPSGESFVNFNMSEKVNETDGAYWNSEQSLFNKNETSDYWSASKAKDTVAGINENQDYWSTQLEEKSDSLTIPRVEKKPDYWSQTKKSKDSLPQNLNQN